MARTVVNNAQVPHLWANQSQEHARGNGSISFTGKVLYSYAEPIGALITAPNGETVALLISRTWSVTTSSHQSAARDAVSHLCSFTVPDIHGRYAYANGIDHAGNLEYLVKQYNDEVKRLFAKRNAPESWMFSHLAGLQASATRYAATFNLPEVNLDFTGDTDKINEFHNTPDKQAKRAAKAERERQYREAEQAAIAARRAAAIAANAQSVAEWRSCQRSALPYDARLDDEGGALVRINGDTLQTSLGAEVPLDHAVKVFRRVAMCKSAGHEWHRNGQTIRVGLFQVDKILADGTFFAGCHRFSWSEIESAARAAGVTTEGAAA
jgi:hypothetical protein